MTRPIFARLFALVLVTLFLGACSAPPEEVVVGVDQAPFFKEAEGKEESGTLKAGTQVEVLAVQDKLVSISTADKGKGWIYRHHLCLASELEDRRARGNVPKYTVTVGWDNGEMILKAGSRIPLEPSLSLSPKGMAVWFDKSAYGKEFSIERMAYGKDMPLIPGHYITVKPDTLCFFDKNQNIVELPVLAESYRPSRK